ncbi:MAG TPA: response regulator transcription factor [Solirubrobacterales bacterium]|nr:response regulator transcription factor [Solirubrobacterales bacterium]
MNANHRPGETNIVCEDDDATRELLCENLRADRFHALGARGGADALRLVEVNRPNLLLLDLALPDLSGLEVLRAIRGGSGEVDDRRDPDLPVIMLSGYGTEVDRVRGLTEGADDYLVKPHSYPELLARIDGLLRRSRHRSGSLIRVADIAIDLVSHLVSVGGELRHLTRKEFILLQALASDPERVFTKQELLVKAWGTSSNEHTRTLDAHASRLRRKLDPEDGRYVINVWSVGYKLMGQQ